MTPAQQAALETLIDRSLTTGEIAAIDAYLDPNNRNDVAITEILSQGRTKLVKKPVGNGDILDAIGFTAGNALLDAVYGNTDFRYVKSELERGDLDISRPIVRQALDMMAGVVAGFTQEHADVVKALAEAHDPLQLIEVSRVLNTAGGIPNGG